LSTSKKQKEPLFTPELFTGGPSYFGLKEAAPRFSRPLAAVMAPAPPMPHAVPAGMAPILPKPHAIFIQQQRVKHGFTGGKNKGTAASNLPETEPKMPAQSKP
jgi:hypothetical protein